MEMNQLIDLTLNEQILTEGGSILPDDFKGEWWCIYCWIDYARQ